MENMALKYAMKLEGILCEYLDCNCHEFGVKANFDLVNKDWRGPINFALGYKYANSNNDKNMKKEINFFLGDILLGSSISDLVNQYENKDVAYKRIDEIIVEFEKILKM